MIAAFIGRLVSPFAVPLAAVAAGLVVMVGMIAWDVVVDDPAVAREARRGYVDRAELRAEKAARAEAERQLAAVARARDGYRLALAAADARNAADVERIEREIADHETRLEAAGRSCRLDPADIEWLRQP